MKNFRALIFPFAALAFSSIAHAAPVQYQITATYTKETDNTGALINENDHFFEYGTTASIAFYYDASAPTGYFTNRPSTTNFEAVLDHGVLSDYLALSNISLNINEHTLYYSQGSAKTFNSNNTFTSSRDAILLVPAHENFNELSFDGFALMLPVVAITGPTSMLPDTSLPSSLTGIDSNEIAFQFIFNQSGELRFAYFENGAISQVPLPSSALFFLSGLIGLGANAARKLKR